MRLCLFNVKYSPNLGDGLLSEALEQALHQLGCDPGGTYSVDLSARTAYSRGSASRSATLKALDTLPTAVRRIGIRIPLALKLRRQWLPHYQAHLAGADALVLGGGNLLSDVDLNFPTKCAAALRLAADRGLPTAIYGVGVAESWSPAGLSLMRRALAAARPCHVSVRDLPSKQRFDTLFAEAAGRDAEITRDPGLLVSRHIQGRKHAVAEGAIGLCVTSAIAVRYHSSCKITDAGLAEWYAALCGRLSDLGRPIVAFTNGSPEDELFLDGIAGRLQVAGGAGFARVRVDTPHDLAILVAGFSLLVAHRMHALIAGYSFGVPIVALRWDPKVDAFMQSMGSDQGSIPTDPGTVDAVAALARTLLGRRRDQATDRNRVLDEAHAGVARLYDALRQEVS